MKAISVSIAAVAALLCGTAIASAADLIVEDVALAETSDPVDWSGLYAGLHVGLGVGQIGNVTEDEIAPFAIDEDEYGYDVSGLLAGLQVGGLFQTGQFVLGLQGDLSWANLNGEYTNSVPDEDTATIEWLASLTARAGVAMDNVLLYGLAGLAVAGATSDYEGDVLDHTFTGYTIGVGAAVQLDPQWSIFAEYAFSSFGDEDVYYPGHDESYTYDLDLSTFKVGVNYRF